MKLSIISVSYNTKALLKQTLTAIFQSTLESSDYEVFVVDNASSDGSVDMVKKNFPQVKLIQSHSNLGFAGGNNLAIKKSTAEYILLLNSDTKIYSDALKKLINFMDAHPKAGIASGQLLYASGEIQPHGGSIPRLSNIAAWMLFIDDLPFIKHFFPAYQQTSLNFYQQSQQLGWVAGAAMILRQKMLNEIGLLDDKIFMYGEDVDLSLRARKAHWQIWNVPDAKITHLQFQSSKGIGENAILGEYRGLKYIFKKHKPKWELGILILLLKIGAILRMAVFGTILRDKIKYDIYKQAFSLD